MLLWLPGLWPDSQIFAAAIGCGVFVFFGLFILTLWVPGYDKSNEVATASIKAGWLFILIGFLIGIFGTFVFLLVCATYVAYLCWVVYRSVRVAFNRG